MSFELSSRSFAPQAEIPQRHAREFDNVSPELHWRDAPAGTRELALICEDPDAPQAEPWVHWLVYGIPASAEALPEGLSKGAEAREPHVLQGRNSWDDLGWDGPLPPKGHGRHRYQFKLYALDRPLGLEPGVDARTLRAAIAAHKLAETRVTGTFER
jgi:Raf kinase inhibitor-like YbhB/YbcL family protein